MVRRKRWTKEELEFLIRNYSSMDNRTLAAVLGRSVASVQHQARRLDLRKDKSYWDKIHLERCKRRLMELVGHDSVEAF